ncbi:hypothetical protein [Aeropyrum camini]|uniref:hypothetical protein n=1 Tax=Aeropyrum camini TaxID=229980 RepID=UPI000788CC08|nr:hypothetical protein [Aeropyrum camini]
MSLYINVDGKLETQHLTIASTPVEGFLQISSTGGLDVNLSDVYNVSLSINTGGDTVITLPQDSSASHGLQLEVVSTGYLTVRDGIVTSDSIRLLGGKVFIYNASLNAGELWMEGDEVSVSSGVLNAETAITIASPLIYLVSSDVKAEELYIQYDIEYGAGLVVAVDSSLGSQPESPGMILDFRSGFTTISVESTLSLSSIQVESASYSILSLVSSTLESKSLTISASQEGALDLVSLSSRVNIDNKLSIVSGGVSLELLSSTFNAGECEIAEGSIIESVASDVNNGCSVNVPLETVDYTGWSVRLGSSEEASGELLLRIAEGPEYMVSYVAVGGWYIYVALVSTPSSNVVLELEIPSTDCKDILIADPLSGNVVGVGKAIEKDGGCLLTSSLVLETPSRLFLALEYLEPDVEKVTYTTTTTVTTTQTLTETISHTQTLVRTTTTSEFILSTTTETLESTIEKTVERTLESTVTYTQWETRTVEARSTAPWAVAAALAAVIAGLLGYMLLRGRVS